jgi:hypothetical protein
VKCPSGDCPEAIGAVLYLEAVDKGFRLHRCTAFLSAAGEAVSNGHCYEPSFGDGYFFSQSHGYRKIKSVKNRVNGGGADAAVFELETSFDKIKPLVPARGAKPAYTKLTGYFSAAASSDSQIRLILDKVECLVHRHEVEFPYGIQENPSVLRAFDCPGAHGNSGGPLLADVSSGTVEAIQHGIPETVPRRPWIEATNLRCLDFFGAPAGDCTEVSDQSIQTRARAYEAALQARIHRRQAMDAAVKSGISFQAKAYRLASEGEEYEVLHFPDCRIEKDPASSIAILSERVRVTRDEWAAAEIEVAGMQVTQAGIKAAGGEMYTLTPAWSPQFAPYANPANDLRRVFGSESDIALPLCPR